MFFGPKSWKKYDIYWLLKSCCFELFRDVKYGLVLSQKVDGKMIFTDYWTVLVLNSVMGNTVFFSVKKLMERWYLLALFELSMIFQDLGNMLFVQWRSRWRLWRLPFKPTSRIRETKITRSRDQIVIRLYGVGLLIVCYHPARFDGYR